MSPIIIAIAAFIGVAALVGGVAVVFRDNSGSKVEDRLDVLTGVSSPSAGKESVLTQDSVLARPLDSVPGLVETLISRFANINLLFEQADTSLTVPRLAMISGVIALAGAGLGAATGLHLALVPLAVSRRVLIPGSRPRRSRVVEVPWTLSASTAPSTDRAKPSGSLPAQVHSTTSSLPSTLSLKLGLARARTVAALAWAKDEV